MPRNIFKQVNDDKDTKNAKLIEVDEKYAKHLEKHRLQEEKRKLEAKYKDELSSTEDEEDHFLSDVDDSPEEIKRYVEHFIMLKNNDPRLKDPNYSYVMKPPKKKQERSQDGVVSIAKFKSESSKFGLDDDDDNDDDEEVEEEDDNKTSRNKKSEKKDTEELEDWQKELYKKAGFDSLSEKDQFLLQYFVESRYRGRGGEDEEEDDFDFGDQDSSEEERFEEEAREHERLYNFRFEHPDSAELEAIPRKVENCVVPKESKRKKGREGKKERKQEEFLRKKEEVNRLKALKRKEIEEKLSQIKEAAGAELELDKEALEEDYDPEEHDKMMQELFNEDYDQVEEEAVPDFPLDEDDEEIHLDDWTGPVQQETEEQEVYAEEQPSTSRGITAAHQDKTSRKRKKSLFWEKLNAVKPKFDPESGKTFEEYLEDYYKLDFEDIVGGMPTRFKYRRVAPNDFGLTTEEIIAAKEEELNSWANFRKVVQRRSEREEEYDRQAFQKKAQKPGKKESVLKSVYSEEADLEALPEPPKKKRRKHSKKKNFTV